MPGLSKPNRFLVLYGSQTGQAEAIAKEIVEKADAHGLKADLYELGKTEKKFNIEKENCVVIVTSTTGDGDPPDMALKFVRRLKKKTLPDDFLVNLNYALLGLGDTNYSNFCNAAKALDSRLEELGAQRFYPSGWGDDAVGLEIAVEPWIDGLFPVLCKFLGQPYNVISIDKTVVKSPPETLEGNLTMSNNSDESERPDVQNNSTDGASGREKEDTKDAGVGNGSVVQTPDHVNSEPKEDSLRTLVSPLGSDTLTIPMLSPPFLRVEYLDDQTQDTSMSLPQNGASFASAASPVTMATVIYSAVMTHPQALKKTLCLRLDVKNSDMDYQPGDAISVVCNNSDEDVHRILERLAVSDKANKVCEISVLSDTRKKNAAVPPYCPPRSTLHHLFSSCVDIRDVPKKALLRVLAEYTSDEQEHRRLQELCSKQGAADYTRFVREACLCVLDLLVTFTSCRPPVERILEHLPRLQARPYSVCSSPLSDPGVLEVTFNILCKPSGDGRMFDRTGVCTGMLDRMTRPIQRSYTEQLSSAEAVISGDMASMQISHIQVAVFTRTNQHFHLPSDLTVPVVMVGPGTGVAPFVGFLRHREALRTNMADPDKYGETWLFFGCRHSDRDYLYRNELARFKENGVLTRLCVCFSRDEQSPEMPRYVQESILRHSKELVPLIDLGAKIFVCGDAKNMAKDVNEAFKTSLQDVKGLDSEEANKQLMRLRLYKYYLEDVWT